MLTWASRRARHWSERAIARPTSALLGFFSLVTLLAHQPVTSRSVPLQPTAGSTTTTPTRSDTLALVRRRLSTEATVPTSGCAADGAKVPRALLDHLAGLLCSAA